MLGFIFFHEKFCLRIITKKNKKLLKVFMDCDFTNKYRQNHQKAYYLQVQPINIV